MTVLTLGLYGAFPSGRAGVSDLLAFGKAAAGTAVLRPGWIWGMASRRLSLAYDPDGVPDEYFLIDPAGRVDYHNSVPVSTLSQLLSAARKGGAPSPAAGSVSPEATLR